MQIPNRYTLSDQLQPGGMGEIFECIDTHLDRRVVLKILKTGEDDRRLLDEQKALIKLRSKHVVQLYDVISTNERLQQKAIVLEYIDGQDLTQCASINEGLKILWQIACGLSDIHTAEVIHRDIKPNNIRINPTGLVKIYDFGLSRNSGPEAQTRSIIGTPGYMAPELWQWGEDISFDKSIDVYAFGILTFQLFNLQLPDELLQRPPIELKTDSGLYSILPDEIAAVIESCVSYDFHARPSIHEVESILRKHLLKNKHRALLVLGDSIHELNATKPTTTITVGTLGALGIRYDGLHFKITSAQGSVTVNNMIINVDDELPACCVITFGAGNYRTFITFDVSNPEVMA